MKMKQHKGCKRVWSVFLWTSVRNTCFITVRRVWCCTYLSWYWSMSFLILHWRFFLICVVTLSAFKKKSCHSPPAFFDPFLKSIFMADRTFCWRKELTCGRAQSPVRLLVHCCNALFSTNWWHKCVDLLLEELAVGGVTHT